MGKDDGDLNKKADEGLEGGKAEFPRMGILPEVIDGGKCSEEAQGCRVMAKK